MFIRKNSSVVLKLLREVIFSDKIKIEFRMEDKDFSRKRKQPFGEVLLFMFNLLRKSLAIEIDNFTHYLNSKIERSTVESFTKSAFVQKRQKIKPEVFKYLSQIITSNTYVKSNLNLNFFNDYRILAVDGSKITLPYTQNLKEEFGESKNNTNTVVVQARASILYDVLNRLVLDSSLENLKLGERQLALRHSDQWRKNDLILYDRGYVSYDFKYEHIKKGVDYLIRTSVTHSNVVKAFVNSGKRSSIVAIFPNQKHPLEGKECTKDSSLKI
jgi:hypothetical protein